MPRTLAPLDARVLRALQLTSGHTVRDGARLRDIGGPGRLPVSVLARIVGASYEATAGELRSLERAGLVRYCGGASYELAPRDADTVTCAGCRRVFSACSVAVEVQPDGTVACHGCDEITGPDDN